jgi:hypothetical protein
MARRGALVGRAWHETPLTHAAQAVLAHHAPDALDVDAPALGPQGVGDTSAALAPPALLVDPHDRLPPRGVQVTAGGSPASLSGEES